MMIGVANAVTNVTKVTTAGSTPQISSEYGTKYSEQQIQDLISKYAIVYDINETKVLETIRCESRFKNVQSDIVKNGEREDSWGIVQIHLPSNPKVTKEEALNPEFAIAFITKEFSEGRQKKWSCYKKLYQS